jgi:hypothetical protein
VQVERADAGRVEDLGAHEVQRVDVEQDVDAPLAEVVGQLRVADALGGQRRHPEFGGD